ncbi:MAG: aminotransferase class V-fold PLP-dependent enzyme [Syntrophorhabdus sp.]
MLQRLIYLDNAATTFPKPASVLNRMVEIYLQMGVSPGRGSYDMAVEAEEMVTNTRQKLAHFFGAPDPDRVIFTNNATDALNILLQGMLKPGDHVVSTRLEHNSVLRPLNHLHMKGIIEYDLVPFDANGFVDPGDILRSIRTNTKLVIMCHASNVLGTIQPVQEVGRLCSERGVPLFIDAAQTAGLIPINMKSWFLAGVAFTGHKSMLGPTGIGGLILNQEVEIEPTHFGGTGVDSKSLVHTPSFPHRLEAGTLNLLGIIGISESLAFLLHEGIEAIHRREMDLLHRLHDGFSHFKTINIYGPKNLSDHVGLITVNVEGMSPEDVGSILDADFGIAVREGLHCAPLVHESLGTSPKGGVRFSLGPFTTEEDIDATLAAMATIARIKNCC